MPATAQNRFLDPSILAELSNIELVAKTVVQGFIAGLHRSPDFGFSQEFAEYRAYSPGDDLRHVDWNVFARTDKAYLRRYRGETNTEIVVVLDASASMAFTSGGVSKLDYSRFLAAALIYLAHVQRDSTGLIAFHDDVAQFVPPSSRHGQLMRLLHAIDIIQPGARTNFDHPFQQLQQFQKRPGITVVISDFLAAPQDIISAVEPLRFRGNEVILFQVLDSDELRPSIKDPVLLVDMESDEALEVSPDYARNEYQTKMSEHLRALSAAAQGAGCEYFLMTTDRRLDDALREYFNIRQRRI